MNNTAIEKIEKEFSMAVFEEFKEIFNRDCFQVILPMPLDASNIPQNEYQIEVKHTQVTNLTKWPKTSIVANLYFEAEGYRELVHYWEVEEAGDSLTVDKINWPSFVDKLVSKIKSGPKITELVEKFEKRPVSLDVGCDKEEFDTGKVVEVFLTGFKGKFGQTSREFNRMVVQASSGEIVNGAECELGDNYKVFKVENNFIKIKYRAPGDCENQSVKFTIYNSCEVLSEDKLLLHATKIKDRLVEKDFALNCYDAKISIKKTYHKILNTSHRDLVNKTLETRNLNESTEANASLYLTLTETVDMPVLNQTWQYFMPTTVTITSFNSNYLENKHMSGPNYETNVDITRITKTYKLEGKEYIAQFPPWMLVIDNETNKAVKLIPAGYGVEYDYNETEQINSVHGNKKDSRTSTKTGSKSFKLGPVGEEVQDPTIKTSDTWIQDYLEREGVELPPGVTIPQVSNEETIKKIQPDILVKYRDGRTSFGGEGSRKIEKDLEYGKQEENLYYSWKMIVKL